MYKINKLLAAKQEVFHTNGLALLWDIRNRNTLYTTIKRYVAKGTLIPIHKGLYATMPIISLDPERVGIAVVHGYAYISTESILAEAGLLFQSIPYITLI